MDVTEKKINPKKKQNEDVIRTGRFYPGVRVYIQKCRKCGMRHESTHMLFVCQNRGVYCSGTMSIILDFYDLKRGGYEELGISS